MSAQLTQTALDLHLAISTMIQDHEDGDFALPRLAKTHLGILKEKNLAMGRALREDGDNLGRLVHAINAHAPQAISARLAAFEFSTPTVGVPSEIMWMPGGVHTITATRAGQPVEATIRVDSGTAAVAQRALGKLLAASAQRPYFDFDHDNGKASAWPLEFVWRDGPQPGVYVRVEWTASGSASVSGKEYRAFSPSFFVDDQVPAHVTGAPLNMGGLVNDPAFKAMRPIWAKGAEQKNSMNKHQRLMALLASLATLQGEQNALLAKAGAEAAKPDDFKAKGDEISAKLREAAGLQAEISAEAATSEDASQKLAAAESENALLKAKAAALQADAEIRAKADAKAAIDAAIARGAIAAQDTATQNQWAALLAKDAGAATLLAGLPGNPALGGAVVPTNAAAGHRIDVGQGDRIQALEAYGKETDCAIRAQMWRKDLRPRAEKGDDFVEAVEAIGRRVREGKHPISAANSLGTLAGTLVVQRSLDYLKHSFPELTRICTDYSAEGAKFNHAVTVRLRGNLTATTFVPANGYVDQDATTTDVPVTIDQHQYVQVKFGVNELASTMRGLFDEQEEPMHYALGLAMTNNLFSKIVAAAITNSTTVLIANWGRNSVVDLNTSLVGQKAAGTNRTLLMNSAYFGKLAKDSTLVNLATYQTAEKGLITANTLPPIAGLTPIEVPTLPDNGESLAALGFRRDALAMATRPPTDYTTALAGLPSNGLVQLVQNPDTGITVMLVQFVDHLAGAARGRVAIMHGAAVGQGASAHRIKSA